MGIFFSFNFSPFFVSSEYKKCHKKCHLKKSNIKKCCIKSHYKKGHYKKIYYKKSLRKNVRKKYYKNNVIKKLLILNSISLNWLVLLILIFQSSRDASTAAFLELFSIFGKGQTMPYYAHELFDCYLADSGELARRERQQLTVHLQLHMVYMMTTWMTLASWRGEKGSS